MNWIQKLPKKERVEKMTKLSETARERRKQAFEALEFYEKLREEIKKDNSDRLLANWVRENVL